MPRLEITELIFVECNIVNNDYQRDSRVLYTFVPNKSFLQLLVVSPKGFLLCVILYYIFSYIEVWFTGQNSEPLEINITLINS